MIQRWTNVKLLLNKYKIAIEQIDQYDMIHIGQ